MAKASRPLTSEGRSHALARCEGYHVVLTTIEGKPLQYSYLAARELLRDLLVAVIECADKQAGMLLGVDKEKRVIRTATRMALADGDGSGD